MIIYNGQLICQFAAEKLGVLNKEDFRKRRMPQVGLYETGES